MRVERFVMFIHKIDAMQKYLRQIRASLGSDTDMKGVHTLWVYLLYIHPDGLTSAEIAECCAVDRSLVSREIEMLRENCIVELQDSNGRRAYNSNVCLTEKGKEYAREIQKRALAIQEEVDEGITADELNTFYATADKIMKNFEKVVSKND